MHLYTDEGDIDTTANHPFYVIGKGWVAAGDLVAGDEVYNLDGTTSTILGSEIEILDEPVLVYNLEVEELHSYFVGCVPVLVHNYDKLPKNAQQSYDDYEDVGWRSHRKQTDGTGAGRKWHNDGRHNSMILPKEDAKGNAIEYYEFDVNNKKPNMSRDNERFLRDNHGNVYYTKDHYINIRPVTPKK